MTNAVQSGRVKVIGTPNDSIAKRFLITCFCATAPFVEKNRDAIRRFNDALQRAAQFTNSHHAEAVAAVARFWGIDPAVLANMKKTVTATTLDPKDIQPLIDAASRYGVIPARLAAKSMIAPGVS